MTASAPAQLTLEELIARTTERFGPPRSRYEDAPERRRSIDARFAEFHAANPHVYAEIVKLARRARGRGATRIGIKMLWEVLRWQLEVETYSPAGDAFKLNNNFTSRYVRLLAEEHPDLAPMFEQRELRAH